MEKTNVKESSKLGNSGAIKQTVPGTIPPQNPQDSSIFFRKLPPEIRLAIYSRVFHSTRLAFGVRPISLSCAIRLRPAQNSLSLLRVCRRVASEIGHSWSGQILFIFEDIETMLNKLTALQPSTLANMRHVRVSGDPLLLLVDDYKDRRRGLTYTLKLLPGLCLDRLTVLGQMGPEASYDQLDDLIKHSDGWKELCYLSYNSAALGFPKINRESGQHEDSQRAPQPSTWRSALASRDGPTASVSIYRSSHPGEHGFMISRPATRQDFAGQSAEPGKEYGIEEDVALMAPGEKDKELLVVARRGDGVDCTEKPRSSADIREFRPGMTWQQIRCRGIDCLRERSGDDDLNSSFSNEDAEHDVDEDGNPIKEDIYKHVDDYEWTASH